MNTFIFITLRDRPELKNDAAKWFHDFHSVMDKYNIGRCVWNYKEMDFEVSPDFR